MFRIYYDDGSVVEGSSRSNWKNARNDGVQAVVAFPRSQPIRWNYETNGEVHVVTDRDLWTGEDTYDPFGYGIKYGKLIDINKYREIWERACADSIT